MLPTHTRTRSRLDCRRWLVSILSSVGGKWKEFAFVMIHLRDDFCILVCGGISRLLVMHWGLSLMYLKINIKDIEIHELNCE